MIYSNISILVICILYSIILHSIHCEYSNVLIVESIFSIPSHPSIHSFIHSFIHSYSFTEHNLHNAIVIYINRYWLLVIMFSNSSSSAVWQRVSNDGESGWTKRQRALRRMNASIRCRSAAVVKPHHALDAYCSLAMTTEWKTVCSAESSIPCLRKTLRA